VVPTAALGLEALRTGVMATDGLGNLLAASRLTTESGQNYADAFARVWNGDASDAFFRSVSEAVNIPSLLTRYGITAGMSPPVDR
jgi:hypothetical protein